MFQKPDTMVSYNSPGTGSLEFPSFRQNFQSALQKLIRQKDFNQQHLKVGYNPSGRTPTKTTWKRRRRRKNFINKGLNAITNQKDSVSSKKKPTKTPEPTGSEFFSNRTDIPQGKTHFKRQKRSKETRCGIERTRFAINTKIGFGQHQKNGILLRRYKD